MTVVPPGTSAADGLRADSLLRLEHQLLAARDLGTADLRARLQWIEDTAAAASDAGLDEEGQSAALHLRAALGAIVKWSQGPKEPDSLVGLDALVRTLLARAQLGLLRSAAAAYDALVDARVPHRAACIEARDALRGLARAVEKGEPPSPDVAARLERVRASLPRQ